LNPLIVFTDGSVDSKTHIGYGAYLILSDLTLSLHIQKAKVKIKKFESTSSTKLELQILLYALNEIAITFAGETKCITIYTDSQTIVKLPARREKLEQQHYYAKSGKRLNNAELYQEFFKLIDQFNCQFIKVKGHKAKSAKDEIDQFYELVDRASRAALRAYM
jgi:ribonuclease HI